MNDMLKRETYECDFCVVGGGLSGSFAAIAAARHGQRVILLQDRPMPGGNASSEVRMWIRGAWGKYNRESGLLEELEERNIHYNPTLNSNLNDASLYEMLEENENIRVFYNCSVLDAETSGNRILSVTGWQLTTYTFITVRAKIFADCSGDCILAPLTGALCRKGRESRAEYGETLAKETADTMTMGMSIILAARETDHPVRFTPPAFAYRYPTDDSFSNGVGESIHAQNRSHSIGTSKDNLWWIELGGEIDTLHDADRVRAELLKSVYGVWDHIKNQGDHGMENWEIDWIGFLPGKRETFRYIGDTVVTEQDILSGGNYPDEIAYGGWPLDDHNPYGMKTGGAAPSVMMPAPSPYGLPYRALYSKNIENLTFAGRNISVTHVALSSTRVMATCATLGQAMGTGVAIALKYSTTPRGVYEEHLPELQKTLMDDGMFLPHFTRPVSDITRKAHLNLPAAEREALLNGHERPHSDGDKNFAEIPVGGTLRFTFDSPEEIGTLRLLFDRDYERLSISENEKMRIYAMKLHTGLDFRPVKTAATLVKAFSVCADGEEIFRTEENFTALVKIPVNRMLQTLEVRFLSTHGAETVHLFSADLL